MSLVLGLGVLGLRFGGWGFGLGFWGSVFGEEMAVHSHIRSCGLTVQGLGFGGSGLMIWGSGD